VIGEHGWVPPHDVLLLVLASRSFCPCYNETNDVSDKVKCHYEKENVKESPTLGAEKDLDPLPYF
jgi:hypothetical protein